MKLVNTRSEIKEAVDYIEKIREQCEHNAMLNNTLIAIKLKVWNLIEFVEMDERNVDETMKGKDTNIFNS